MSKIYCDPVLTLLPLDICTYDMVRAVLNSGAYTSIVYLPAPLAPAPLSTTYSKSPESRVLLNNGSCTNTAHLPRVGVYCCALQLIWGMYEHRPPRVPGDPPDDTAEPLELISMRAASDERLVLVGYNIPVDASRLSMVLVKAIASLS